LQVQVRQRAEHTGVGGFQIGGALEVGGRLRRMAERELREPEKKRELTICLAQAPQSAGDLGGQLANGAIGAGRDGEPGARHIEVGGHPRARMQRCERHGEQALPTQLRPAVTACRARRRQRTTQRAGRIAEEHGRVVVEIVPDLDAVRDTIAARWNVRADVHALDISDSASVDRLAALHPELKMQAESQHLVDAFKQSHPEQWKQVQNPNHDVIDTYDAKLRMTENPSNLQEEMDSLNAQWVKLSSSSIIEQYAFIPAQPRPISYLTANFLHGGWLHLLGNMLFLWVFGNNVEDRMGRLRYLIFYLVGGLVAAGLQLVSDPSSAIPTIGASGSIAAVLGGYLRLFPWSLIRAMTRKVLNEGRPVVFYVHPREIDPTNPRLPMSTYRQFKSYVNLKGTESKLHNILSEFKVTTFRNHIESHFRESAPAPYCPAPVAARSAA